MSTCLSLDQEHLINQVLDDRGAMTLPNLISLLNSDFLPKPIKPLDLLFSIKSSITNGTIDKQKILPSRLPTPLLREEVIALKQVAAEAQILNIKYSLSELSKLVLERSESLRSLAEMEMKLRFILIPLHAEDDREDEDEEDN